MCANFSAVPFVRFVSVMSFFSVPFMTLKYDILPTNGSATVLNMNTAVSPSGSGLIFSPFSSLSPYLSRGFGKDAAIMSSRGATPMSVAAEPTITGAIEPFIMPRLRAVCISSSVNFSPAKNFSIISSLVSASDSTSISRNAFTFSMLSSGIGISFIVPSFMYS